MNFVTIDYLAHWPLWLPEAVLACTTLLAVVFGAFRPKATWVYAFILSGVAVAFALLLLMGVQDYALFLGHARLDALSFVLRATALLALISGLLYVRPYLLRQDRDQFEYYVLWALATLGIMVMSSAQHLLIIYLGLELFSLSLYALVAWQRKSVKAAEAAMKYYLLGAMASGMLLYGMSLVYGLTGDLSLQGIQQVWQAGSDSPLAWVAMSFLMVAVAFKFGLVPFHTWVADVYQGAMGVTTLYVGSIAKLGAFALFARIMLDMVDAAQLDWQNWFMYFGALSLVVGNVLALIQNNLYRLLGYSAVGQMGFMVLGFAAGTVQGYQAALFYTVSYVLTMLALLGILVWLHTEKRELRVLDDLKGLVRDQQGWALLLCGLLLSLIGIPPLLGFYAKLNVLTALFAEGYAGLAVLALVFSVVAAYYYLNLIRLMVFESAEHAVLASRPWFARAWLILNAALVVLLGLWPAGLLAWCAAALS